MRDEVVMQFFLAFFSVSLFLLIASLHAHAHDSSVSFNDQDARSIARKALTDGKTKTAETISSALLRQDPNDADGLLIRAHLRRASGQLDAALKNATRAWRLAERSALRFEAAYLVAGILTQQEKFTRAQFWLRRADQVAPSHASRVGNGCVEADRAADGHALRRCV